jgi:prepilin-type N-terminal cleavage/methylation domain-containing protein
MTMSRRSYRILRMMSRLQQNLPANAAGFTLIETVVALVLTGVLLSGLSSIVGTSLKRWDAGTHRVQDVETLVLAANRIADDIAATIALPEMPLHPVPLFKGGERQLTLIRQAGSPGDQGLEFVQMTASTSGGLLRIRGTAARLTSLMNVSSSDPTLLLPPDFGVTFAYGGSDMIWQRDWTGDTLPSVVQITVARQAQFPADAWIFTVPLRTMWPASCGAATSFTDCASVAAGRQVGTATPGSDGPSELQIQPRDPEAPQ